MEGVDGAVVVFGCAAGAGEEWFGICSLGICWDVGFGLGVGALEVNLDCLNVIRGPGGGIPCSSRLRFAAVGSLDGVSVVRTLVDRKKCIRP